MSNEIAGAYKFKVKGQEIVLEYTWDAIAEINDKYADGHSLTNPKQLADILSIGLKEHHPEIASAATVKAWKLPIIVAVEHVTKALNISYFGQPDKPASEGDENPPIDAIPEA